MKFHDEVVEALSEVIQQYQLTSICEDENTTTLVKQDQYALSVSWTNHFEIDFCYFFEKDGRVVSTFPLFIIGKYRQELISDDELIKGPGLGIDALRNYGLMLNSAGQDFLRGGNEIATNEDVTRHLREVSRPMIEFYEKYVLT